MIDLSIYKDMPLLGVAIGDVYGSTYDLCVEPLKDINDEFLPGSSITDDTVCTLAIAQALMNCNYKYKNLKEEVVKQLRLFGKKYPYADYGPRFKKWLNSDDPKPYGSIGNGAPMRVAPVAYVARSLEECLYLAKQVTIVTHNTKSAIHGAQAVAAAIYLLIHKEMTLEQLKEYINKTFYKIDTDFKKTKAYYLDNALTVGTVPECFSALFNFPSNFNDPVINAVKLGGDMDTLGSITGALAQAAHGADPIAGYVVYNKILDEYQREVITLFEKHYKLIK